MKAKIQKWLKEIINKLKDPMWRIDRLKTIAIYVFGFIVGALSRTIALYLCERFVYHGDDITLKDGDFMAYNKDEKAWSYYRKKED